MEYVVFIIAILLVLTLMFFTVKKKKAYWLPTQFFLLLAVIFVGLTQVSPSQDGWADLGYIIFGVFSLMAMVVVAGITSIIKRKKIDADEE